MKERFPRLVSTVRLNNNTLSCTYIAVLKDTESCLITQEINGVYDLTLTYPNTGKYADDIYIGRYIEANYFYGNTFFNEEGSQYSLIGTERSELFKIYKIEKDFNTLTVYAHHYSYEAEGIMVSPFSMTGTLSSIATKILSSCLNNSANMGFGITSAGNYGEEQFEVKEYKSLREVLWGSEGSFLSKFGGSFTLIKNVIWWSPETEPYQGKETGFKIEYGSNMTEFDYIVDGDEVYDGVLGYASDSENNHTFYGFYTTQTSISSAKKLLRVDFTDKFDNNFPEYVDGKNWYDELNSLCESYFNSNNKGTPNVSLTTSYVVDLINLGLLGYSGDIKERVTLNDNVYVVFKTYGLSVKLKVVKIIYNSISGKNESIELNQPLKTLADTIANIII